MRKLEHCAISTVHSTDHSEYTLELFFSSTTRQITAKNRRLSFCLLTSYYGSLVHVQHISISLVDYLNCQITYSGLKPRLLFLTKQRVVMVDRRYESCAVSSKMYVHVRNCMTKHMVISVSVWHLITIYVLSVEELRTLCADPLFARNLDLEATIFSCVCPRGWSVVNCRLKEKRYTSLRRFREVLTCEALKFN